LYPQSSQMKISDLLRTLCRDGTEVNSKKIDVSSTCICIQSLSSFLAMPSLVSCSIFLTAYMNFEQPRKAGEGLVQLLRHQITRRTWSWRNVDLVSVIMATCHKPTAVVSKWIIVGFTALWWTTGGVQYKSPCCTVVVGSMYSSFVPSTWHARLWVFKGKCMPYHCITAQQASKVLYSVS